MRYLIAALLMLGGLTFALQAADPPAETKYPKLDFKNGAWADPGFFPRSVWMQPVKSAKKYKDAGVNIYMNLWQGPTEEQLRVLAEAGMPVMVELNDLAVRHKDDPQITVLAPVLNSPTVPGGATVTSSVPASKEVADAGLPPIALMTKQHQGVT